MLESKPANFQIVQPPGNFRRFPPEISSLRAISGFEGPDSLMKQEKPLSVGILLKNFVLFKLRFEIAAIFLQLQSMGTSKKHLQRKQISSGKRSLSKNFSGLRGFTKGLFIETPPRGHLGLQKIFTPLGENQGGGRPRSVERKLPGLLQNSRILPFSEKIFSLQCLFPYQFQGVVLKRTEEIFFFSRNKGRKEKKQQQSP